MDRRVIRGGCWRGMVQLGGVGCSGVWWGAVGCGGEVVGGERSCLRDQTHFTNQLVPIGVRGQT